MEGGAALMIVSRIVARPLVTERDFLPARPSTRQQRPSNDPRHLTVQANADVLLGLISRPAVSASKEAGDDR